VIIALCEEAKGGKPSESCLLMGDTYGKVCIAVDEIMPGGILENLDTESILSMSKLKPIT
jgi:hypothetical protein